MPSVLTFDSGLGGLSVLGELRRLLPDHRHVYLADDAGFPYGDRTEADLEARLETVIGAALPHLRPSVVVIACNTASTLALASLRKRFPVPFVGTVPAVKPAAAGSRSRMISVLATPGTIARSYTRDLIATHAGDAAVTLVGSRRLAALVERELLDDPPADEEILAEVAPCFVTAEDGRRTDVVVLACTHYPLLLPRLRALAPWPVDWLDPAPAIARQAARLLHGSDGGIPSDGEAHLLATGSLVDAPAAARLLDRFGFARPARRLPLPTPNAA